MPEKNIRLFKKVLFYFLLWTDWFSKTQNKTEKNIQMLFLKIPETG